MADLRSRELTAQPTRHTVKAGPKHHRTRRKVVALFGRAEARDFDRATFATMLDSLARVDDATLADFDADPVVSRAWFSAWADELRTV